MIAGNDWPIGSQPQTEEAGNLNLVRLILGHKLLLVVCIGAGCGLGYLQYTKTIPVYGSAARVRLVQPPRVIPDGGGVQRQDPLDTHAVLIRSPLVIDRAISKYELDRLPSLRGNTAAAVLSGLDVQRSSASKEILDLSFKGADRFDCQKVLSAVVAAYIDYLGESQQTSAERTLHLITQAKDELLKTLVEKQKSYDAFREQADLGWWGDDVKNIHTQRLGQVEGRRASAIISKSEAESKLRAVEDLRDRGESREAILLMLDQLRPGGSASETTRKTASISQQLMPLMLEERLLLSKLGAGHPKVQEVRLRIAEMRSLLNDQQAENSTDGGSTKPLPDLLSVYLDSVRHEIESYQTQIEHLTELYKQEEAAAKLLSADENKIRSMKEDIQRTKSLFEAVLTSLQSAELVKDTASMNAEIVIAPGPGGKVSPVLSRTISIGGALGLILGMGISLLIEMTDKNYRRPADIHQDLRAPVIGHIPVIDIAREQKTIVDPAISPSLVAFHRPTSALAEAYRNVRTALTIGSGGAHRVIQVTSPSAGDGKTTLAANLAVTIANSGKRCLLIDCDFRRPRVQRVFGIDNEVGVTSILEDGVDVGDALRGSPIGNLDLLTSGPRTRKPSELLMSQKFGALIKVLREKYDFVIIDSPPVLAVSDPSAIAPVVDGMLLVLRLSRQSRPMAARARSILELVSAKVLGVVVNGVGDQSGYGSNYNGVPYGTDGMYGVYGMYRYGYGNVGYFDERGANQNTDSKRSQSPGQAPANPNA